MLTIFEDIAKYVKLRGKVATIDNMVFRLHYRYTVAALLICTVLVCSQQYFGDHIRCLADKSLEERVVNTYCFFTTTFTVERHLNFTANTKGSVAAYPGVGPFIPGEPVIYHAYYQWVPFVLFGQALLFYVPHFMWKHMDAGLIKAMVSGFENAALASSDKRTELSGRIIPSSKDIKEKIKHVQRVFLSRLHVNRVWAVFMVFCEVLNLANVLLQIWLIDVFLGGKFLKLGTLFVGADTDDEIHPIDHVFPKVTKCTFHKYGSSGSIQKHDALCVMSLNVVNEKIYVFLWFWFIILFGATALSLLYRFITLLLHSRSIKFNRLVFTWTCNVRVDTRCIQTVTAACYFSDWMMLHYLAVSMDGFVFREVYHGLAEEIEEYQKKVAARNTIGHRNVGYQGEEMHTLTEGSGNSTVSVQIP